MPSVYLNGKRRQLTAKSVVGKGGEADIYDLGGGQVLKLYKQPEDPDYAGQASAQTGARMRLAEYQRKLPAFPRNLPDRVVSPIELAYESPNGQIAGYSMRYLQNMEVLLRLGDRTYREQGGIDGNAVAASFLDLHQLVRQLHRAGVVIGDFNDLNVLFDGGGQVYLVDADSMQFGGFTCRTFTARFMDPLLSQPGRLLAARPHNVDSDWYAFNNMLFQSLVFTDPYGGVHRPANGKRLQHDDRVLARLTVFNSDVLYPKPALPLSSLPDELLEHFQRVYLHDERGEFPARLLEQLRWTTCTNCGLVHARNRCPVCAAPGAVKETVTRRGNVTATRVFRTSGQILAASHQNGKLLYLYHENGSFRREGGMEVAKGGLDRQLRFRLNGRRTLLAQRHDLLVLEPGIKPERVQVDLAGNLPVFDTNHQDYFWLQDGQLKRNGRYGSETLGDVLPGRTLFWTGPRFGFGFYQAGSLNRGFVFDLDRRQLNDQVALPALPGQLVDATCFFSDKLAWFMLSLQEHGQLVNRCFVIDAKGQLVAEAQTRPDEESWLRPGIRGHFASGSSLYAATDEGIVRVSIANGYTYVEQAFPDTEPFVSSDSKLLPGEGGIYAVSAHEIRLLKIQ